MARASAAASPFTAISDPTRRRVLRLLGERERAVSELQGSLGVSQSALSQHLAVLRKARLVVRRREGRRGLYRLDPAPLGEVAAWVAQFGRFWDARLDRLGRYLDQESP